jgi:DNA-binding Xre family transcriptional regulator
MSASQNTTITTLERLCRGLRCSVGELFELVRDAPRSSLR